MTDDLTGWDATTVGSRTSVDAHNGSLSDATLLDATAYGNLVDAASDEYILDLAVYDDMLFILSRSDTAGDTYLSAVTYDIPTDGSTAVSVTGVVNLGGAKDYLVLDNLFDAAYDITGSGYGGIDFGADSGDTLMYVASTDGLVYTFNVSNAPVPEPATLALLALGGAALAGGSIRRRRHNR